MNILPKRFDVRAIVANNGVDRYGRRARDWESDAVDVPFAERVWVDAYDWPRRVIADVTDDALLQRF